MINTLQKRNNFYFPSDDTHFSGAAYQQAHRNNSLRHVTNFGTALDVGAHVGTWAVDLGLYFDKVICFEPIAEHRECLLKNIADMDQLEDSKSKFEVLPFALGNENNVEIALSYASEGNSGTASIDTDYSNGTYKAILRTLDSFDFGVDSIDYIKVDVEGFELQFLKGAVETIKRYKPVINIEIKNTCERFGTAPQEIADFITQDLQMKCVGKTVADYIFTY